MQNLPHPISLLENIIIIPSTHHPSGISLPINPPLPSRIRPLALIGRPAVQNLELAHGVLPLIQWKDRMCVVEYLPNAFEAFKGGISAALLVDYPESAVGPVE